MCRKYFNRSHLLRPTNIYPESFEIPVCSIRYYWIHSFRSAETRIVKRSDVGSNINFYIKFGDLFRKINITFFGDQRYFISWELIFCGQNLLQIYKLQLQDSILFEKSFIGIFLLNINNSIWNIGLPDKGRIKVSADRFSFCNWKECSTNRYWHRHWNGFLLTE